MSIRLGEIQKAVVENRTLTPYQDDLRILAGALNPEQPWTIKEVCEELLVFDYQSAETSREYLIGPKDNPDSFQGEYLRTLRDLGLPESKLSEADDFLFLPAIEKE